MHLNSLEDILQSPEQASERPSDKQLHATEVRLGVPLPDDYKAFLKVYGSGSINNFLGIFNPVSTNPYVNLFANIVPEIKGYNEAKEDTPELGIRIVPYPLTRYGGLLKFAATDNGDFFFWKTQGLPNNWPVIGIETRGDDCDIVEEGLNGLLKSWITGRRRFNLLPPASDPPTFTPSTPW